MASRPNYRYAIPYSSYHFEGFKAGLVALYMAIIIAMRYLILFFIFESNKTLHCFYTHGPNNIHETHSCSYVLKVSVQYFVVMHSGGPKQLCYSQSNAAVCNIIGD